jgi:predicted DNA binding protein
MMAKIRVVGEHGCPMASLSENTSTRVVLQDRLTADSEDQSVIEEARVLGRADEADFGIDVIDSWSHAEEMTVRFSRDEDQGCVCSKIGELNYPIHEVEADDGDLLLTLYLAEASELRPILRELNENGIDYSVEQIVNRSNDGTDDGSPRLETVNLDQLTDRQRRVLEVAVRMGYFRPESGVNAGDLAEQLDVSISTVREHIQRAENKIFSGLL